MKEYFIDPRGEVQLRVQPVQEQITNKKNEQNSNRLLLLKDRIKQDRIELGDGKADQFFYSPG